jgi:copper homeostasis protein CutC
LSSYIDQVNADIDFNTVKADINLAFRTGRAAIVATYATRDAQIDIKSQTGYSSSS